MEQLTLGVIGAGQMGCGIAQVAASKGHRVIVQDISLEHAERGIQKLGGGLERLVAKGKMTGEEREALLANLTPTGDLEALAGADVVIEAATEQQELKLELFRKLDAICRPETLLASNTSSISITMLGAATRRPDKVIGMHFMNPVPVMQLVEIIRGLATSDETYQRIDGMARALGKTTVLAQDFPGFIVNRILMPMINEAVFALYEGVAGVEDIDQAMKLGTNQPMGPLTLADFIGLDTCLAILNVLHDGLGDSKYRPCPLLKKYVTAGYLGRKSGRGFYRY